MEGEAVYDGVEKLVFCADIGTTQSAVCLIHFSPGAVPRARLVSRWPGDRTSSKIPSLILYDSSGAPRAHGASALDEGVQVTAKEEGWSTCKHWKLFLHPDIGMSAPPPYSEAPIAAPATTTGSTVSRLLSIMRGGGDKGESEKNGKAFELWPLPAGVTVEKVYEDWLSYIVASAKQWFAETDPDGTYIWSKLEQKMVFVLSHPNGWGLQEQTILRDALANAVPEAMLGMKEVTDRVVFVSEAEAAVHFALHYTASTSLDGWLSPGSQFMVLDAGGSTVDTTVYVVEKTIPKLRIREVKPSACVQAGAIFPTRNAMSIIKAKLSDSTYNDADILADIMIQFDVKTKCAFDDLNIDHLIKIGPDSSNDPACGIRRGRLTIKGSEVAEAFKPCIDLILESVADQMEETTVKSILLSGGFGESPYLKRRLREIYEPKGIAVLTADEPSKKAVAEGTALYYIRESVVARSARFSFGCPVSKPPDFFPRQLRNVGKCYTYTHADGRKLQDGAFGAIIVKGRVLQTDEVITQSFNKGVRCDKDAKTSMSIKLCISTSTILDNPSIMIDKKGEYLPEYTHICNIEADFSALCTDRNREKGSDGDYWQLNFNVAICFGGTSLKAWVFWTEDGVEMKCPATIIPSAYR